MKSFHFKLIIMLFLMTLCLNLSLQAQVWSDLRSKAAPESFFWIQGFSEMPKVKWSEEVWVSWYGRRFHGRRTANGERYNQHAMTCASRTLAFGTILEVKNVDNGKVVRLRVNDRGPYHRRRVLDLSKAAAKKLGFVKRGVTKVVYRIVELPE